MSQYSSTGTGPTEVVTSDAVHTSSHTADSSNIKAALNATSVQHDEDLPPVSAVREVTSCQLFLLLLLSPLLVLLVALYFLIACPFILSGYCSRQPPSALVKPPLSPADESLLSSYRRSRRGLWLFQRSWLPPPSTPPRAVVFVVHGLAEHISRPGYEELARRLTAQGYAVHGMDAQGHGRSSGERCYARRWAEVVDDEVDFIAAFNDVYPPTLPRVLFGHSLGGLIALHVLLRGERQPLGDWQWAAVVLSAPAAIGDPKVVTPLNVFLARVGSFLAPKARVDKLDVAILSRNKEAVEVNRRDELIDHEGLRARFGREILRAQDEVKERGLKGVRMPVLALHGGGDVLVPKASSVWVYEAVGSAQKRLCVYDKGYHEMFEDPEKDKFYDDILAFIAENVSRSGMAPAGQEGVDEEVGQYAS